MESLFKRAIFIAAIVALSAVPAQASCGSANCFLVTGTQEGVTEPGRVVLDLSYRFIPMDRVQKGSDSADVALVPRVDFENGVIVPNGHQEFRTNNELMQLDISVGVSPRLTLAMAVPFFNQRTHEHTHVPGEFSRQDGTSGFGDIRLMARYAVWISTKNLAIAGLGVKTPSGEYKLLDHDGAINEPTIQPGTGSWDPLVSVYYAYEILPHALNAFFSGSYQVATENSLDYRFGSTFLLNSGVSYRIVENVLTSLQVNLRHAPRDEFKGDDVSSTGGRFVYVTPGATVQATPQTAFYAHLQLPVYQFVNDVNIVPRYGLVVGASYAF